MQMRVQYDFDRDFGICGMFSLMSIVGVICSESIVFYDLWGMRVAH